VHLARESHDFVCGGHLEVELRRDALLHAQHVVVLDVTAVLAQMHRDAARAGALGRERRLQRIGIGVPRACRQRRDVIDVHAESDVSGHRSSLRPMPASV
jgi:hypothetical protein